MMPDFGAIHMGQVVDRNDPEGLHRAKVCVPGIVEPGAWAWPLGFAGSGSAASGHYEPPANNSTVAVLFIDGDPDQPCFLAGPWGRGDVPTNGAIEGNDRQNAVTEDQEWRIERDSRGASTMFTISHKGSSIALRIDAESGVIKVGGTDATEGAILGTTYRSAEVSYIGGLHAALAALATALKGIPLTAAAGTALESALNLLPSTFRSDSNAYVSTKVKVK